MSRGGPYFAVGTALSESPCPEAKAVVAATSWLLRQRNEAGIWGGDDQLDRFISTNHAAMTLLALGFPTTSAALVPALDYLRSLRPDAQLSFFWRAATFLNLSADHELVAADSEYVWHNLRRIGVHKDYPVPFFLLKLMRFADPPLELSFRQQDVLDWIMEDWTDDECWYGRTSITSMALALIYDLSEERIGSKAARCRDFLVERFLDLPNNQGQFDANLVDDCFTVFNLCERPLLKEDSYQELESLVEAAASRVLDEMKGGEYWESGPPFGGAIGSTIYPTAVAVRALMSFAVGRRPEFRSQIGSLMLDAAARTTAVAARGGGEPLWGSADATRDEDLCFVLMPFEKKLTEIYERYVKAAITKNSGLRCERADDINKPTVVMRDVWGQINAARVIVADLTGSNANVFYELGLAHAIAKPVILIVQKRRGRSQTLPFDVSGVRAIVYEDSPSGYERLASKIVEYIRAQGLGRLGEED